MPRYRRWRRPPASSTAGGLDGGEVGHAGYQGDDALEKGVAVGADGGVGVVHQNGVEEGIDGLAQRTNGSKSRHIVAGGQVLGILPAGAREDLSQIRTSSSLLVAL